MKNIKSEFFKYVSLNIAGMIGISLYIIADTFFISKALGANGITALNFSLVIFGIMQGIGLMVGIGGAARRSILIGLGKKDEADKIFMNSLYFGAVAAIIFMIAGIFFSTGISYALGADSETIAHSEAYMCTMLCFAPCYIMNNIMMANIRNDGNPKICTIAMLVSSMSNIVLDYIFIFKFSMGMYGAIFATGLSPVISLGILCTHLAGKNNSLKIKAITPSLIRIKSLLNLGVSSFISEFASAASLTAFNLILLKIGGNTAGAAYGVVANAALVALSVFNGISQGVQPIASRYSVSVEKVRKIIKYTVFTSVIGGILIFSAVFFTAEQITAIFNSEKNPILAEMAENGLRIYFTGFIFAGINITGAALLSAVDMPKPAFVISVLRSAVLIIPAMLLLSVILKINGVWLSFTVSEFLTCIVTICSLLRHPKSASVLRS